jgi:hypothetical protein
MQEGGRGVGGIEWGGGLPSVGLEAVVRNVRACNAASLAWLFVCMAIKKKLVETGFFGGHTPASSDVTVDNERPHRNQLTKTSYLTMKPMSLHDFVVE